MSVVPSQSGIVPSSSSVIPPSSDFLRVFDEGGKFNGAAPLTGDGGHPHAATPPLQNGGGHGPNSSSGATNRAVADPRSKFKFPFVRYDEIKLKLDNQYLIKGLLPAQGLAPVYGAPSSGKSFLTLHAALHIAAGLEYAGRKVRKGRVVYIAAEGQGAFQNRVYAARKALGVQAEDFILIEVAPNLGVQGGDTDILTKNISAQLRPGEKPPDLIVIDTISQTLFGQDENREGLAMFVVNCALIRNELGGLILPVHHVGKDEGRGMRGWSGLHGACDAEWEVLYKDGERSARLAKNKDGPSDITWKFRLQPTELGIDRDGDPVTTCTVEIIGEPAVGGVRSIPSVDQAIADEDLFLRLLDQVTEQGRHVSANPSSTYAPTVFAKLQDANGVAKHRFERAMNNLLKTSRIRVEEDGPPSKKRSFLARFL